MKDKSRFAGLLAVAVSVILAAAVAHGGDEEDGGRIIFTKPVKAVVFDHKIHVAEAGLECDSCHDGIFEMETGQAESRDDFTMESLYQGKYCGACHDGDTAFASNTRCTLCHIGVKGYMREMGGGEAARSGH